MGDALCGPSNALQNFQKHASADRTIQQDRLASRGHPAQGFRSHNTNVGALDQEFDSFESSFSGPPLSEPHQNRPHFFPAAAQVLTQTPAYHPHHQPGVDGGWASDFQKLHISGPPHSGPQNQLHQPLHQRPAGTNWQDEFQRQTQQPVQTPATFGGNLRYGPSTGGMGFTAPGPFSTYDDASQSTEANSSAVAGTFDESAFEAAFAEAHAEVAQQERNFEQENEQEPDMVLSEPARIGSDRIFASQEEGINEADELAKTAGQLLDSVSHDQSQKFKESNFLALMRQLRDREVAVEGDQIRQVAQPLHPGGQFYPEQKNPSLHFETKKSDMGVVSNDAGPNQRVPIQASEGVLSEDRTGSGGDAWDGEFGSKRSANDIFGDNNALYEGYPLGTFLVDRRATQALNCVFRHDLECL